MSYKVRARHFFFPSKARDSPSSNGAQPEKARPEHNTSQPPENSRPNANAAEKGACQTTRHPAWQRSSQQLPNQRTNQLGAARPPPGRPTKSGRKDMHCTHEGRKAEKTGKNTKRLEKTRKNTKRYEKARKGTHYTQDGPRGRKGVHCTRLSPKQQRRARDSKTEKGGTKPKSDQVARNVRHVLKDRTQQVPTRLKLQRRKPSKMCKWANGARGRKPSRGREPTRQHHPTRRPSAKRWNGTHGKSRQS